MSDTEEGVMMEEEEEEDFESTPAGGDEEDADDGDDSATSTPTKGKKVASKKGAAAAGGGGKASPAKKPAAEKKRKAPDTASASSSLGGGAAKKAKPITSESVAKDTLRTYMKQQNRPYTALVIYENLHHAIKKPTLMKLCEELVEEGDLQAKDFKKTRIYMLKQSDDDVVTPEELEEIQAKEARVKESLAEQRAQNSKLDAQIRALNNEPSDEDLAKQLAAYKKTIDTLNAKLARFKGDKNPVTKEGMNKAQLAFNEAFKQWRIRKRAADDMIDGMCGDEGNPKDVRERFSIETDEEAGDKLADWKDFVKEIKK